ncbi:MAG: hypothetical protein J6Y35_03865 [Bacteroidales bacterium]|nr:hypothetical protein [Bacteroidales bacterium]
METNDFEKLMEEAPQRADAGKIEMIEQAAGDTVGGSVEDPVPDPEPKTITMSVGQFGATVAGLYCSVSDFVYKKVKKTETAPAWSDMEREQLNSAITPVLEQYNITVSPLTNLIMTLAVIEAMRYTQPTKKAAEIIENATE